jgi:aminopeptidase-like protein
LPPLAGQRQPDRHRRRRRAGRRDARRAPRLTWRFVFGPGTIGSLAWLSRNEAAAAICAGLVIGLLGDGAPADLQAQPARRPRHRPRRPMRAASRVPAARIVDFEPYGYDERQFCSPGFDLPVGRLTRSPNGQYPEYHTSADDLGLIKPECLAESVRALGEHDRGARREPHAA